MYVPVLCGRKTGKKFNGQKINLLKTKQIILGHLPENLSLINHVHSRNFPEVKKKPSGKRFSTLPLWRSNSFTGANTARASLVHFSARYCSEKKSADLHKILHSWKQCQDDTNTCKRRCFKQISLATILKCNFWRLVWPSEVLSEANNSAILSQYLVDFIQLLWLLSSHAQHIMHPNTLVRTIMFCRFPSGRRRERNYEGTMSECQKALVIKNAPGAFPFDAGLWAFSTRTIVRVLCMCIFDTGHFWLANNQNSANSTCRSHDHKHHKNVDMNHANKFGTTKISEQECYA